MRKEYSHIEDALYGLLKVSLWGDDPRMDYSELSETEWQEVYRLSGKQGVRGLVLDGILTLQESMQPGEELMLTWATYVEIQKRRYEHNMYVLQELKNALAEIGIEMLLLKGKGLASYYPNPEHREYGDIDVYLFDKWEAGNELLREKGRFLKKQDKHTVFKYNNVLVENHKTLIDLIKEGDLCSKKQRRAFDEVERTLIEIVRNEPPCLLEQQVRIPSPTSNFLFLLMHAGNHLGDELVLRHLCDWACFLAANKGKYNEQCIEKVLELLNFREFCLLLTDVAIRWVGMPTEYAPSFYKPCGRGRNEKRLMDSLFYHYPKVNEVKRNTVWCKWQRFYLQQWKYDLFYQWHLPERLVCTLWIWYKKKLKHNN